MIGPAQPVDERGRRIVGHDMPGQLGGDVMRGGGAAREIGQNGAGLCLTLLIVALAQNGALARLVQGGGEDEAAHRQGIGQRFGQSPRPMPVTVQPVMARANSVTSACVYPLRTPSVWSSMISAQGFH
jgi:hypothetical protein